MENLLTIAVLLPLASAFLAFLLPAKKPILKKRGIVKFEIRPTKHQATYDALDGYEFGMGLAEAWWWPQARTLWLYPVPVEYRKAVNRKTNGA
jgi:hypothetical protein